MPTAIFDGERNACIKMSFKKYNLLHVLCLFQWQNVAALVRKNSANRDIADVIHYMLSHDYSACSILMMAWIVSRMLE